MSILSPWIRKSSGKKALPRISEVPGTPRTPERPKASAGNPGDTHVVAVVRALAGLSIRSLKRTVELVLVAASIVGLALVGQRLLCSTGGIEIRKLWDSPGSSFISGDGEMYLLTNEGQSSVWTPSGKLKDLGSTSGETMLAGEALVTIEVDKIVFRDLTRETTTSAQAFDNERLIGHLPGGPFLTARPSLGGKFGEPWRLRAVVQGASTLWELDLPGPPSREVLQGTQLLAGILDLSSGGENLVSKVDVERGCVLWTTPIGKGMWRAIGVNSNGGTVAVLDRQVCCLGVGGQILWAVTLAEPAIAAAVAHDKIFLASKREGSKAFSKLLFPYEITALSMDGAVLWSKLLTDKPVKLQEWTPVPTKTGFNLDTGGGSGADSSVGSGAESKDGSGAESGTIVALGEHHVVGFSSRDGERMFSLKVGSCPRVLAGNSLLLADEHGVALVRLDP